MYDLNSKFDIKQHKKHYIHYLEVVIFPDGHIEYAVPSHQEKLIQVCQDLLGISRYELMKLCPKEYHFDFMTWLCNMTGCISVWEHYLIKSNINPITPEQQDTIDQLISAELLLL